MFPGGCSPRESTNTKTTTSRRGSLLAETRDTAEVSDVASIAARDGELRPVPGACAGVLAAVDGDPLCAAVNGEAGL